MRIHYYAFSKDKSHAVDKRRFYLWSSSKESKEHHIVTLSPDEKTEQIADVSIVSGSFDLCKFIRKDWPTGEGSKVLQLVDGYGLYKEKRLRDLIRGIVKYLKGEISFPVLSYSNLLRKAIKEADSVICASVEQSAIIQKLNERVVFVPDNHSFLYRRVSPSPCPEDSINLLWEGLPESLNSLFSLRRHLGSLNESRSVNLSIVTNSKGYKVGGAFFPFDVEEVIKNKLSPFVTSIRFYTWSDVNLLNAAASSNIAILPVNMNSKLHMLKHESRLLLYMQLGLPVVCQNLPSYLRIAKEADLRNLVFESPEHFTEIIFWLSVEENWIATVSKVDKFIRENHSLIAYQSRWNRVINFIGAKATTK